MVLCNYVSLGCLPCSFLSFEFPQRLYSISREPRSSYLFTSLCLILSLLLLQALRFPPFAPPTAYSLMISVMCYCVDVLHLCHEHHVIYSTAISFVLQRE